MLRNISNRSRATGVGILIILAFSMLIYVFTGNIPLGALADIVSGLAVLGIPVLLFPVFNVGKNRALCMTYLSSKMVEGIVMIIGGFLYYLRYS